MNAFCLPGGKVAVYTGILPIVQNENGLAVVMGHEISHAIARHGAERMAQQRLVELGTVAVGVASSRMDPAKRMAVMAALGVGAAIRNPAAVLTRAGIGSRLHGSALSLDRLLRSHRSNQFQVRMPEALALQSKSCPEQ